MVFEGADGAFSRKHAVQPRWDKLEGDFVGGEQVLEALRAFVVKPVDFWCEAADGEIIIQFGCSSS